MFWFLIFILDTSWEDTGDNIILLKQLNGSNKFPHSLSQTVVSRDVLKHDIRSYLKAVKMLNRWAWGQQTNDQTEKQKSKPVEKFRCAVPSSVFISVRRWSFFSFSVCEKWELRRGEKSRRPGRFITQTLPVLVFFSARRCRNIHYMHEEFSLVARIDPASPVPQHVLITSTLFLFFKSVMRSTLCWVSCQTRVCVMLKVKSSMDGVLFPALQRYHVGMWSICYRFLSFLE